MEYGFYTERYGGARIDDSAVFYPLARRAEAVMARFERLYTISYPTPESRALAVCAIADELALHPGKQAVKSARAGSVSESYAAPSPAEAAASEGKRMYEAAQKYCEIYRGIR